MKFWPLFFLCIFKLDIISFFQCGKYVISSVSGYILHEKNVSINLLPWTKGEFFAGILLEALPKLILLKYLNADGN